MQYSFDPLFVAVYKFGKADICAQADMYLHNAELREIYTSLQLLCERDVALFYHELRRLAKESLLEFLEPKDIIYLANHTRLEEGLRQYIIEYAYRTFSRADYVDLVSVLSGIS